MHIYMKLKSEYTRIYHGKSIDYIVNLIIDFNKFYVYDKVINEFVSKDIYDQIELLERQ
jgi:hypothetical protein